MVGTELCSLYLKRSDAELIKEFEGGVVMPMIEITKCLNSDHQTLGYCQ